MRISELDYNLPPELIAQEPARERASSRMMMLDRTDLSIKDGSFADLAGELRAGDLLVMNNTRVFPARLYGTIQTGARIEVFLVRETAPNTWLALARPARRLRPGKVIEFDPRLSGEVIEKNHDGSIMIRFDAKGDLAAIVDEIGSTPLPPYIKRDKLHEDSDRERYQTVYASERGAIAAPTAGLHFTPDILDEIESRGVERVEVTLHVGYGTFEPVRVDDVSEHSVSAERYYISAPAAEKLNAAKAEGRRVVAVGTTTTRTLESNFTRHGKFAPGDDLADLTILPGYEFKAVDAMLTNFHLPQSSLLILISTFAGREFIMNAYRHAVAERYRFFSYGDCMFIS